MVLRPEAVRARLLRLEEVISRLERLSSLGARELAEHFQESWAVERGLQLACEIALDIGNHILTAHFGAAAQDYEDVIARLGEVGVLDAGLRQRLKGLGGFRNVLVHDYMRLDLDRVAEILKEAPHDFGDFAAAVRAWLGALPAI